MQEFFSISRKMTVKIATLEKGVISAHNLQTTGELVSGTGISIVAIIQIIKNIIDFENTDINFFIVYSFYHHPSSVTL